MNNPARLRLVIAAALFAGWIGWLTYLAATATGGTVVSRPQFYVAAAEVVATLQAGPGGRSPAPTVTVGKVLWPGEPPAGIQPDAELTVGNLAGVGPGQGWAGAGTYVLPLSPSGDGYQVTPIPFSPGYPAPGEERGVRIYPATAEVLRQVEVINDDRRGS